MPDVVKLVPVVEALEYDGTNAEEAGSFYHLAQKVNMGGAEPGDLWIKFGPELANGIMGPFSIGTVFLRNSIIDQQYKTTTWEALGSNRMAVAVDGTLQEVIEDPMS